MNANTKEIFPQRLIEQREIKGVSRQTAADELEISRASLEYYEKGLRVPDVVVLAKLADYYNVSADYLLGRSDVRSVDPSQKIHVACEVTGLSEKALLNLLTIKQHGISVNMLLEREELSDIYAHLSTIVQLSIAQGYYIDVIEWFINNCDKFVLDNNKICEIKCKQHKKTFPDFKQNCSECSSDFRDKETDVDYVTKIVQKAFGDIIGRDLGFSFDAYSDPDCVVDSYQDKIDLEEFKLSKLLPPLVRNVQNNADCQSAYKANDKYVRNELERKLHGLEKILNRERKESDNNKDDIAVFCEEISLEIKALQTFLNKYDEDFDLIQQKGAPDNGSNNPKKE